MKSSLVKGTAPEANRSLVLLAILLTLGGCSSGDDNNASVSASDQEGLLGEDVNGQPSEPADSGDNGDADADVVDEPSEVGEPIEQEPLDESSMDDPIEEESPSGSPDEGSSPVEESSEQAGSTQVPVETEEPTEQDPLDEGPVDEPTEEEDPTASPDEESTGTGDGSPETEPAETEEPATEPSDVSSGLPSSASERLDTLFAVSNGDTFEPMIAALERLGTRDQNAERTPISSAPDPDFPRAGPREVFACPDGGTFAVAAGSVSGVGPSYSTIAEGCAIGELTVDGTFYEDTTINRTGGPSSRDLRVQDYRLVDAATGTTTMDSGEVTLREPAAQDGGEYVPVRWIARELTVSGGGESYTVANQVTTWPESISPDATVTFGLEVSIEGLDGGGYADATLETVTPLRPAEAGAERFASGTVRVVDGGSGRVETLDADGGDREAFVLTLEQGGATTSYGVPWSEVEGFVRLEPDAATRP